MFKVTQLVGDRAGLEPSASILLLLLFLFVTACGLNLKLYFIGYYFSVVFGEFTIYKVLFNIIIFMCLLSKVLYMTK